MPTTVRALTVALLLGRPLLLSSSASATPAPSAEADGGAHLGEEVVALVVDDDEGGEVLDVDLPDGLHAELGVLEDLDLLDAVLGQPGRGPPIEPR